MTSLRLPLTLGLVLGLAPLLALGLLPGCGGGSSSSPAPCPAEAAAAVIAAQGVYRYERGLPGPYWLLGTITLEQSGDQVTVTGTTYDNANDRALVGLGTLVGNRLDITLVPQNGDLDYTADVTFLFGDGGASFCVSFSDTNNDVGPMGSYRGRLTP